MRATWYVLEDGRVVDPNECEGDEKGALRHKDGVAVAKRGDAYSSRGVDIDAANARDVTAGDGKPDAKDREMKPAASGKGYRTRAAKTE